MSDKPSKSDPVEKSGSAIPEPKEGGAAERDPAMTEHGDFIVPPMSPAPEADSDYEYDGYENEDEDESSRGAPVVTRSEFQRSTKDADVAEPRARRKKVKKRRRRDDKGPRWDRDGRPDGDAHENESARSSRESRSHSALESSETGDVEGAGTSDKGKRVRKKRRIPTKVESFYLRSSKLFVVASILLLVTVAVIGTYGTIRMAGQSTNAAIADAKASEADNPEIDPEVEKLMPNFLTHENEVGATEAVEDYLKADGWKEKLNFVRMPEFVGPLMEKWYRRQANVGTDAPAELGDILLRKQVFSEGRVFVMLAARVKPSQKIQFFAIERTVNDDFKVDWEVSEAYQELPLAEFQELRPTKPTTFRVHVRESKYYNREFNDPERYRAFELNYPGRPDFKLYGYVDRSSPLAITLDEAVPMGARSSMILKLAYPENADAIAKEQVIIVALERRDWFR